MGYTLEADGSREMAVAQAIRVQVTAHPKVLRSSRVSSLYLVVYLAFAMPLYLHALVYRLVSVSSDITISK